MAPPRSSSGYCISTTCPGCGGILRLEANFLTTRCAHCGSAVRIKPSTAPPAFLLKPRVERLQVRFFLDRYLKQAGRTLSSTPPEITGVYFPYWRVEAMLLRLRNRIEKRYDIPDWERGEEVVEREQQATEVSLSPYTLTLPADAQAAAFPASLGVRPQIALLYPMTADYLREDFAIWPIRLDATSAFDHARAAAGNLDRLSQSGIKHNQSHLFGGKLSLIYMPYYLCRGKESYLVDAISGEVSPADDLDLPEVDAASTEFGALEIELHRCTNCGYDLPENGSLIQVCAQCESVVRLDATANLGKLPLGFPERQREGDGLFPFYVFDIVAADAGRLQKALRGLKETRQMVIPAFALGNFEALYRLASRMSSACAQSELIELPDWPRQFAPVTVSIAEAQGIAAAIYARALTGKTDAIDSASFNLAAERVRLLFAAFRADGYFFVDEYLGAITFERAAIKS